MSSDSDFTGSADKAGSADLNRGRSRRPLTEMQVIKGGRCNAGPRVWNEGDEYPEPLLKKE